MTKVPSQSRETLSLDFDHFQIQASKDRRCSTRRAVSMASSLADLNSDQNNGENITNYLSSIMAAEDDTEVEEAMQAAIDQKQQQIQERQQRQQGLKKFRVTLPLQKQGAAGSSSAVVESLGMAVCQVEKGRNVLPRVLDLDTLQMEREEQPLSATFLSKNPIDPIFRGLIVCYVAEGGLAWQQGIRCGDRLLSVSATLGDTLWPKSTLEGVQSAISSRKALSSKSGSVSLDLARVDGTSNTLYTTETKLDNQFELTLTRPIGLILQETADGYVQVTGFTESAPNLVRHAIQVGDRVVAVDSSLGDRMWPVSTVEGVISACTSRLPGQSIRMRLERPEVNLQATATAEDVVTASTAGTVASPSVLEQAAASPPVDQKQLLERCRDVLRRYANEGSSTGLNSQSRLFKGKYALPAIVADKVVDALASASATVDTVTLSMIMKSYLSCRQPEKSLRVFEAATGFSADGSSNPPVGIIKGVGGKALVPNESALNLFTATTLLQAHAMRRDLASVRRVLAALEGRSGEMIHGFESAPWPWTGTYGSLQADTKVLNIVIAAAEKIGGNEALDMALEIFNRMAEPNNSSTSQPKKDIVTYNTLISALSNAGNSAEAFRIFDQLKRAGVRPDKYTYTSLIKACVKDGDVDELLYDMRERGVQADVVTYNTMIKTLCEDRKWSQATRLVTEMESRGVSPNSLTYGYLMNAMLQAGKPTACLALFESAYGSARTSAFTENVYVYTTAVTAASMLKNHERALELVMRMNANGIRPNLKTLTAVIGACLASNQFDLASQLFKRIDQPDGYAVAQGIRALCGNNEISTAASLLETHAGGRRIGSMNGKNSMLSYALVFEAAVDGKKFEVARMVITDLLKKGFIPTKKMFEHVLESVRPRRVAQVTDELTEVDGADEKLFDLCLFLIDSLRRRSLPIDGSLYAATLFLGSRLGGISKTIASLIAESRCSADTLAKQLVVVAPTGEESEKEARFEGWENFKLSLIDNNNDDTEAWRKTLNKSFPEVPIRVPNNLMRTVLNAEQAAAVAAKSKARNKRTSTTTDRQSS